MHDDDGPDDSPALASIRALDIVVALLLLVGSAIVILDSLRVGIGWRDDGPAPGFFPFWVAVVLAAATLINLARAIGDRAAGSETFVTRTAFGRILAVLVPTFFYLLAVGGIAIGPVQVPGLGIYIASALFIAGFMLVIGRESLVKSVLIGVGVPFAMFWMFEKWFLVPLPKSPFGIF